MNFTWSTVKEYHLSWLLSWWAVHVSFLWNPNVSMNSIWNTATVLRLILNIQSGRLPLSNSICLGRTSKRHDFDRATEHPSWREASESCWNYRIQDGGLGVFPNVVQWFKSSVDCRDKTDLHLIYYPATNLTLYPNKKILWHHWMFWQPQVFSIWRVKQR